MNDVAGRTGFKPVLSGGRRRSRTLYFAAAALLATLIPLIFFAGFWVRAEFAKGQRDLEALLNSRASTLSQRIDSVVQDELHALRVVSALPALGTDTALFRAEADRVLKLLTDWRLIAVVDTRDRRILLNTAVRAEAPPGLYGDDALLRRVTETREPAVRSVEAGADLILDQSGILLFQPVVQDGEVPFVIVAALRTEGLQKALAKVQSDDRVLAVLVDDRHRILARSRAPETFVGRQASAEFQRSLDGRDSGIFDSRTLDGQPVATAFLRSPTTGWIAVTSLDRAEFDRAASRSVWATILAGVLSVTLAGILAVFLFHNVMERRVSDERLAASRALGELDARLLTTTQDALGEQRKAASEREVLLREIYHRVKNNLQIVQSLLRLGSRNLTRDQREPFENAVRRIGAMARVHTLLYNSPDLASIDFRDYLVELVREASDAFGADERGIATTLEISSMRVPLDTAVPLAFIAVEVLTNAFRHAFPSGREGMITVRAYRESDRGILIISDNGVGMSTARRSLGLTIAAKLAQQIGGQFHEPSQGESTFRLDFPLGTLDTRFDKPAG